MATHKQMPQVPSVSVIMANYKGAKHLPDAIESVLAQTLSDLELIVVDDASPDHSAAVVKLYAERDPRVKLIVTEKNSGPGAARNLALDVAVGEWIAIVDSDDILHAERLQRLIDRATELQADAAADDLLQFSEIDAKADETLLGSAAPKLPKFISVAQFIRSNSAQSTIPPLGYLKPVVRRSALGALRYDENVRIAEDYDFLLRFLLGGGTLTVVSDPLYLYRRHPSSLSYRLSVSHLEAMIDNHRALYTRGYEFPPSTHALLGYRLQALRNGLEYERLVAALKARRVLGALGHMINKPGLIFPLLKSVREHFASRAVAQESRSRQHKVVLVTSNPEFDVAAAAVKYVAPYNEAALETFIVPPYRDVGIDPDAEGERALWCQLADLSVTNDVTVIAHGLAGMYASSFMPKTVSITAILDDPDEEERALRWAKARGMRILRAEGRTFTDAFESARSQVDSTRGRTRPFVGVPLAVGQVTGS